ncbi:hypothetical protein SAMN02745857_03769 [Andreprevotia lacus DSM 23236]|uniref:Uncharacterized protein n=1 Tax=Andreprevotia lacus DSM 23236 TaxID=1121001 RepID=A0A1W1XZD8_9NEIS|nr:hypothetical protein [Andreprevotia lacus]SMC29330.1 hypothetical protein SAMN02745857_03769 [Andreprevotia lacus DSM 23236]
MPPILRTAVAIAFMLASAIAASAPAQLDQAQTALFVQAFTRCDPSLLLQIKPALESAGYVFEAPQRLAKPIEKFRPAMVLKADVQDQFMLDDNDAANVPPVVGKDGTLLSYTALKYQPIMLANGITVAGLRVAAYNDTGKLFFIAFFNKRADAKQFNTLARLHSELGSVRDKTSLVCSRAR